MTAARCVLRKHLVTESDLEAVRARIPCAAEASGVVPGMEVSLYCWDGLTESEPSFALVYEDGGRAVFRPGGGVEWGALQLYRAADGDGLLFVLTDHRDPETGEREAIPLERTPAPPERKPVTEEDRAAHRLQELGQFPDALLKDVQELDAKGRTQEAVDLAFGVMNAATPRHAPTIEWLIQQRNRKEFPFREVSLRLIELARRYAEGGGFQAIRWLDVLISLGPPLVEACLALAGQLDAQHLWNARRRAQFRALAERFEKDGDAAAARAVRGVTPDDPEDDFVDAQKRAAENEARTGRRELAELHWRAALDRRPADRDVAHGLISALQQSGRDGEALAVRRSLVAALRARGDAYSADFEENLAARQDPERPELWLGRAEDHVTKLRWEEAVADLRTALARDSRCCEALLLLGRIGRWTGIGERPEAMRERLFLVDPARAAAFSAECRGASGPGRVVRFSDDASLGWLTVRDSAGLGPDWPLGPARGQVQVPAGGDLTLTVATEARLGLLATLGPDDIQSLKFGEAPVRDADLPYVAGLHGLRHLDLSGSDLACSGFLDDPTRAIGLHLNELSSFIEDGQGVTDRGVALLSGHTRLESLDLSTWGGNDAALARLRPLSALRRLSLQGSSVCGAGLRHLVGLPALRELDLRRSRVSKDALRHLAALPGLERVMLDARRQQWSDEDTARLRELAGRPIEVVREPAPGNGASF